MEWEFPLFHLAKDQKRFGLVVALTTLRQRSLHEVHSGISILTGRSCSGIVLEAEQDQPGGNATNDNPDPTEIWDNLGRKGH